MTSVHNDRKLRQLDFTLLIIFDEIMSSRRLNAAADRLGLTDSAVSHAVRRLSELLGTRLFERKSGGVTPTPAAERLAPLVRQVLIVGGEILEQPASE